MFTTMSAKRVEDNRTKTHVDQLGYDARVTELAAMLGTKGEHARGGAADILRNADAVKQRIAEVKSGRQQPLTAAAT